MIGLNAIRSWRRPLLPSRWSGPTARCLHRGLLALEACSRSTEPHVGAIAQHLIAESILARSPVVACSPRRCRCQVVAGGSSRTIAQHLTAESILAQATLGESPWSWRLWRLASHTSGAMGCSAARVSRPPETARTVAMNGLRDSSTHGAYVRAFRRASGTRTSCADATLTPTTLVPATSWP
jgi:hypothetical protein